MSQTGKPEEALTEYRQELAIFQKLADANAAVSEFQRALAWSHNHIAQVLSQTGKPEETLPELRQALAIFQKLADANPANTEFQNSLSLTSLILAAHQAWFGQAKELAAMLEPVRAFAKETKQAKTAQRVARACSILPSTSKAELDAALALAHKGVELDDGHHRKWTLLALGMAEYRSGHYAAADEALLAAAKAGPNNPWVPGIAAFYRAMSLSRQGKSDEARQLALGAAATMKPLPKDEQHPLADNATHDDLILWLAYKEAKALIHFDEQK